ncbi:MAG: hypothetical protein WA897_03430, partial [Moheibacter sp.]
RAMLMYVAIRSIRPVLHTLQSPMSTPKRIIARTPAGSFTLGGGGLSWSCLQMLFNRSVLF